MWNLGSEDVIREIEQYQPQPGAVLSRLSAAVLAAERLDRVGDEVVDHFVAQARAQGASWSDIGQCMGVSKQAAQQRYVAPRVTPPPPYEQADDMRGLMRHAQDESRALGHRYVGTEHLLLGLLRTPDPATARLLAAVDADDVRAMVVGTVGRGDGPPEEQLPFTPRARKVLAMAQDEAERRGQEAPDARHVLLAVILERKGLAGQVLQRLVGDLDGLRAEVEASLEPGQSG
jgi:ATP-dependent Clp protease ATP-binding subunit ClpA